MSKVYGYDDLDTAFPRHGSSRGFVTFDNYETFHFTTNTPEKVFRDQYMDAKVKRCYYSKDNNATISKIILIHFNN